MSRLNWTLVGSVAFHVVLLVVLQYVSPETFSREEKDVLLPEEKKPKVVKFEPIEEKRPEPKPEPKPEPEKKNPSPRRGAPRASAPAQAAARTTYVDLTVGLDPNSFGGDGIVVPSGETLAGDPNTQPAAMASPPMKPSAPAAPEIVTVQRMPRALSVPRAPYPEAARRRGLQGEIQLSVTVGPEGDVVSVELKKGIDPELDALAIDALRRARFAPAVGSDGKPLRYTIVYRYVFRLEDES